MQRASTRLIDAVTDVMTWLDRGRTATLKALPRFSKVFIRKRQLRVAAAGGGVVSTSLAGTLLFPFWMLALGPIFLGTAHLIADLRYLVCRPGLHRRRLLWLPVGVPLLLAGLGYHSVQWGLVAVAGMGLCAQGAWWKRLLVICTTAALFIGSLELGYLSALLMAHLHNFIAVMLWWCWRPRTTWLQYLVPAGFLAASALIFFGGLTPWSAGMQSHPSSLSPEYHLSYMAPGLAEPWATRLVLLFAFAQSVHYGIWLRLIPEDDRPQESPRTFGASLRALVADMGWPMLLGASAIAITIAAWAVWDLTAAREGYLRMALFHGYLELIAIAFLFIEGRTHSTMPRPIHHGP